MLLCYSRVLVSHPVNSENLLDCNSYFKCWLLCVLSHSITRTCNWGYMSIPLLPSKGLMNVWQINVITYNGPPRCLHVTSIPSCPKTPRNCCWSKWEAEEMALVGHTQSQTYPALPYSRWIILWLCHVLPNGPWPTCSHPLASLSRFWLSDEQYHQRTHSFWRMDFVPDPQLDNLLLSGILQFSRKWQKNSMKKLKRFVQQREELHTCWVCSLVQPRDLHHSLEVSGVPCLHHHGEMEWLMHLQQVRSA